MANIAIIEYKSDLEEAVRNFSLRDTLFLSVSADASYSLSKKGIKFITEEDVLSPEEFKKIGNENFGIAEHWVEELEGALLKLNPIFAEHKFQPFKWHFYRIKILLDAVRIRQILIERLMEREKPSLIGAPVAAIPEQIRDHHILFHRYDSLYGLLVQRIARLKGIETRVWRTPEIEYDSPTPKELISTLLRRIMREIKILSKYRFPLGNSKSNILIGNLVYDIQFIRQRLSGYFNFYYYKDPLNIVSLDYFLKLKGREAGLEKFDVPKAFDSIRITGDAITDEILGKRIQGYTERFIPFLWEGMNYLEAVDQRKNFKAYIHHAGAVDSFSGLPVHYFDSRNKPVLIIQHGAYGYAANRITEYSEFGHNGYFFAWGDGISRMYEKHKKGDCKFIATGSPIIEAIRKKSKRRKEIFKVCYIPGIYRGYTAYYPQGQPCLDSQIFLMEKKFLSALKPYLSRFDITYKVAGTMAKNSSLYGSTPVLDWIKENMQGVKIESRPLQSVIHEFDLFIIDFPSTPLIETLATFAEVLIYIGNPYYVIPDENIEILNKRAILGLTEDDFCDKIRSTLDRGKIISDVNDTSFLEKFGIYLNDGKSLQRMTDNLSRIISKGETKH